MNSLVTPVPLTYVSPVNEASTLTVTVSSNVTSEVNTEKVRFESVKVR